MWSLFCDQSFTPGTIALLRSGMVIDGPHVIASYSEAGAKGGAAICHEWQVLLDRHGLTLRDIAFLTCGIGPGSYTGIRSAIATAKGVSFATALPIVAVSSLLLYAPQVAMEAAIVVDAGVGGFYVQRLTQEALALISESPLQHGTSKPLASNDRRLGQYQKGRIDPPERVEPQQLCVPDAVCLVTNNAAALRGKGVCRTNLMEVPLTCATVARVAYHEWDGGQCCSARTLSPLYLRKTQAEMSLSS